MPLSDEASGIADEDLMIEVQRGDADAFEVLYARHARVVYSLAHRLVGDREAAEDLVQDAMLAAWRNASGYAPVRGSVRSWLLGITRNRGIDMLRARDTRTRRDVALAGEERVAQGAAEPERRLEERSMAKDVRRRVGDLPREQSEVISLAYYGGFTHHEIAQMLRVPLGTVKSRMRLGLGRLRQDIAGGMAGE